MGFVITAVSDLVDRLLNYFDLKKSDSG